MKKLFHQSDKVGKPSGTLLHIGERKVDKVKVRVIDYDEEQLNQKTVVNMGDLKKYRDMDTSTWINVDGLHDIRIIEEIGEIYGLHPLLLEDILNTNQRPKIEDFEDYIFIVLKMIYHHGETSEINAEQISLVIGENFVISFQESEGDVFDPIRERIQKAKGRIRKNKSDYLAYALLDAIVDNYFIILEKIGEKIEDIETDLVDNPTTDTLYSIHDLKREMIYIRKSVWPVREVISFLTREEIKLISESTDIYLRDVYDHTIQVIDSIETFRDMLSGMLDLYMSSISNKMNEIMKVLTIIATIFIPLTFIAGIYGMNFNPEVSSWNMPELNWSMGYPFALIIMAIIAFLMVIYFRRKEWL